MLMSSAVELVLIFIALEISSISTYILAGFRRRTAESAESSLKYFLLGSFATAFFLYGVALIFGATGTTNVYGIAQAICRRSLRCWFTWPSRLMFVGLGFKVASAPFHVWTPDVYEGSPAPVVALMSTGPKAAAFAVLLRVLFATGAPGWFWMVWVSAALSMTHRQHRRAGAAEHQAPAGLLVHRARRISAGRLCRGPARLGISAAIFYAASYAAMNVGAFAIVSHLASARREVRHARRLCRPGPPLAAARRHPHHLPAVADRHSHHRRILRQVLRLLGRAAVESGRAHHHRRHQQRHRCLLLPARHRLHVHA